MRRSADRRWKARSGKGLLPPNNTQWAPEHRGLDLRQELDVELEVPLPIDRAFQLLERVEVIPHGSLPCAQCYIDLFRGPQQRAWSALALPLEDETVVVFNDSHSPRRIRATLMEEFFHLRLEHPPSKIRIYDGLSTERTFARRTESEAYGCGAAALVPYKSLKALVAEGLTDRRIADRFQVSVQLVRYRAKLTRLYRRLEQS